MTRTLAVLRPEPGNAATVARAEAAGFAALSLPLFEVRALPWTAPEVREYDALIVTSANTLRFGGSALAAVKHLPVLAVGPHTAAAARAAGFHVVATGSADAREIAALATARGITRALHLSGEARTLAESGPIAKVVAVYESAALAVDALVLPRLVGTIALLHSARAARRLATLLGDGGIARDAIAIAAFSSAIAHAAGAGWAAIAIAATPDDAALFAAARQVPDATSR